MMCTRTAISADCCDDVDVYENPSHDGAMLEVLWSMYETSQLTDITLIVQHARYTCHRTVLAALSPYFRAMFTTGLNETQKEEVELHEVDPVAVGLLIQYAYTGKVEINPNNAQNLLTAASLFQVLAVQEACAQFMETQLDVTNCVGIYYFAQVHDCAELCVKAHEHVEKNFTEVCLGEEFLALTPDKMSEVLLSNELNVEKEEIVFEALMRWVRHEENTRVPHLGLLLPTIRFGLLNSRYIQENIANNGIIQRCPQCQDLLLDVHEFESNPETYSGSHTFEVILRSGMIKPETCILFIGGVDQSKPSINCFNPLTREAYYMAAFQENSMMGSYDVENPACVITHDNQLFVAGGTYIFRENAGESLSDEDSYDDYEEETVKKDLYQYDNDHNCWVTRTSMLFPKSNFVLAAVNNEIFCFGGLTINQHPTEIVEKYDITQNRWHYVGMMPITLVDLGAVVHNGSIFILGGRTGVGAHNVVMRFEPRTLEWVSLAGMPTPRFNFGACVVDSEIFVAGGQIYSHTSATINRESLRSVEIYNISHNQWRQGPDLPDTMYNVGLFHISAHLYACGTTEFHRSAYRIYRYNVVYRLDLVKEVWDQVEADLCDIRDFSCVSAKMHTRKLAQLFRPEVDT